MLTETVFVDLWADGLLSPFTPLSSLHPTCSQNACVCIAGGIIITYTSVLVIYVMAKS